MYMVGLLKPRNKVISVGIIQNSELFIDCPTVLTVISKSMFTLDNPETKKHQYQNYFFHHQP